MTLRSSTRADSRALPELRPYQRAIVGGVHSSLQTHQRTLVVSPTATGKTVCFLTIAVEAIRSGARVLVLVPAHLVDQTAKRARAAGVPTDTEIGPKKAELFVQCVVASVETLSGDGRVDRFGEEHFQLVLVDEAHHSMAPMWRKLLDYFSMAKVVGFTATPDRLDCQSLMEIYEDLAFEYTIQEAIRDGWLAPIDQRYAFIKGLDFSKVRRDGRQLNAGDLDAVYNHANIIRLMATTAINLMEECKKIVVFCTSIAAARGFAEYLRTLGQPAEAVWGTMGKRKKRKAKEDLESGKLRILTNVDCLTEGWDCPPVDGIVMASSTESRVAYTQRIGRGLRLFPGKERCLVLDFVGDSKHLKLVHSPHVLNPALTDEQAERTQEILMSEPGKSVGGAIQLALEQLAEETFEARLQRELQAKGKEVDPQVELYKIDPFDTSDSGKVFAMMKMSRLEDRWDRECTPAQAEALKRFGVKDPEVLDATNAAQLLDRLILRRNKGLATLRQARKLIQAGTHPSNAFAMTHERAQQGIRELQQNGWRRPARWGPKKKSPHPHASAIEELLEKVARTAE